ATGIRLQTSRGSMDETSLPRSPAVTTSPRHGGAGRTSPIPCGSAPARRTRNRIPSAPGRPAVAPRQTEACIWLLPYSRGRQGFSPSLVRDEGIDCALLQKLGDGFSLRRVFETHALRQLDRDFFRPARIIDPAAHPDHVGRLDAVVMLQNDA